MILAILRVMTLRLLRDRGALILAFILPGAIYAVFAAIFSTASGGDLDLRVALAVESDDEQALAFGKRLQETDVFSVVSDAGWTETQVRESVRLGTSDAGIVLKSALDDREAAPLLIIEEPSREIAATVLMGQLRQILADDMPSVLVRRQAAGIEAITGGFSPQQQAVLDAAMEEMGTGDGGSDDALFAREMAQEETGGPQLKDASVAYYAGATAILFLLFSAMQGAAISLEERHGGIADRLLIGWAGTARMTLGKFLFLTGQGMVQALVVMAVAAILFEVPVLDKLPLLVIASFCAAAVAAGIALFVASLSSSAAQLNTISTFLVLIFSAIGGSMVPSFMMPGWLQSLGWFTPNAWVIDSFYGILARQATFADILPACAILTGTAALCLGAASVISHRLMRL